MRCKAAKKGYRQKKWVKWLGIILDDELEFDIYWKSRIEKARRLMGAINGLETSQWGMSSNSWRSAYTGMIRAVAT